MKSYIFMSIFRLLTENETASVSKAGDTPGDLIRRLLRIWSPAKIARDFRHLPNADTLGDFFFANRGDVALQPCSQAPSAAAIRNFEKSCDKIAQPD